MKQDVITELIELNSRFYEAFAVDFANSRHRPQPGFYRLLEWLPPPRVTLLDVGCGDGRLGRFLHERDALLSYTGVDFSQKLLDRADATTQGRFHRRDLARPEALAGLGHFDLIACLAALQHIPGSENRRRLLGEIAAHLAPGGRFWISTWQFLDSPRQSRKIVPWEAIGLSSDDVEPGDYLLSWQRGGHGLRYVSHIDKSALDRLAFDVNLRLRAHFRSDGKDGKLNLYALLEAAAAPFARDNLTRF